MANYLLREIARTLRDHGYDSITDEFQFPPITGTYKRDSRGQLIHVSNSMSFVKQHKPQVDLFPNHDGGLEVRIHDLNVGCLKLVLDPDGTCKDPRLSEYEMLLGFSLLTEKPAQK